jgi:hypothetical protein
MPRHAILQLVACIAYLPRGVVSFATIERPSFPLHHSVQQRTRQHAVRAAVLPAVSLGAGMIGGAVGVGVAARAPPFEPRTAH